MGGRNVAGVNGGVKRRPGSTARFSEPPACRARAAQQSVRRVRNFRSCQFQPCDLHRACRSASPNFLPCRSRNFASGLSLARNDWLSPTIARSKFLTCHLQLHTKQPLKPVRFPATPLRAGFEALRGVIHTSNPLSKCYSAPLCLFAAPTPLQGLAALRIKAFGCSSHSRPALAAVSSFRYPVLTILRSLSRATAKSVSTALAIVP